MAAAAESASAIESAGSFKARVTASSVGIAVLEAGEARDGAKHMVGLISVGSAATAACWPAAHTPHWSVTAIAAVAAVCGVAANTWAVIAHSAREEALGRAADGLS